MLRSPDELEDVSDYPNLFAKLIADPINKWSNEDLAKLAGENLLRVFSEVEAYANLPKTLAMDPIDEYIKQDELPSIFERCRTSF